MSGERTLINLRGFCLYCLKRMGNESDTGHQSPFPPSPLSTPLRARYQNVHSLPLEERIAPFTDLCRYLGVELPDCYAFGDGSESETLYPPLCDKCHELSARLCILQDELQYIQTRISNTVERIHRRVASTCDKRGAIKREEFNNDFGRKSKGSLSRNRGENPDAKKVNHLLKRFQMGIIAKDHENREKRKRRETNILFPVECRHSLPPEMHMSVRKLPDDHNKLNDVDVDMENEENVQPQFESDEDDLCLTRQEYLPPEETLRSCARNNNENDQCGFEVENVPVQIGSDKPYPDISTILCVDQSTQNCSSQLHAIGNVNDVQRTPSDESDDDDSYHFKTTLVVGAGVTTRSQARRQVNSFRQKEPNHSNHPHDNSRRIKRLQRVNISAQQIT